MVLTGQNAEERGLHREKTAEMKRVTLGNSAECPWQRHLRKPVLGKNHSNGLAVTVPAAATV